MARVLVVEDDPDLREAVEVALGMHGFETRSTPSGLEAVLLAGREPFDVVVLDMDIEDLSGAGAARILRDLGPAPIIAVSGRVTPWQKELLENGASVCLRKPYSFHNLVSLVGSYAAGERAAEALPVDVRRLSPEDMARVSAMSPEKLDRLPFGAIALDEDGRILEFNSYESDASGFSAATIKGMYFADVAPCTQVKEFIGAVREGIQKRELDRVLRFVFPRFGADALVSVRLYYDPGHDRTWVFVSKRNAEPQGAM